jgi:hypothetical protein
MRPQAVRYSSLMGFGLVSGVFFLYAVCAYSQGGVKFPTGGIPM